MGHPITRASHQKCYVLEVLKYEDGYLRSIPKATQYEKSFMHRDAITHVIATELVVNSCDIVSEFTEKGFRRDFIITASQDGHLKFWKKKHSEGVEFVKHFRCHLSKLLFIVVE